MSIPPRPVLGDRLHQSNTPILLVNARLVGSTALSKIYIDRQGIIQKVEPMNDTVNDAFQHQANSDEQICDVAGDWISLGGVDLQINGGLGLAFPEVREEDGDRLQFICDYLWNEGVDGFLPTLVTTSVENIHRSLNVFAQFMKQQSSGARILGVHLEGPFLNPQKRGAHPAEYLLPLTWENVQRVLGEEGAIVKVITLAPELDERQRVIGELRLHGITVSLGHSQATAAQANLAFDQGATMVTHAFNAMPGLHHREPGLLGAALMHPQVSCGFIADGQHVNPMMLDLLLRVSRGELEGKGERGKGEGGREVSGLFLVSDALAPLGLPDGVYPWDCRQIEVQQGTARLADGTLSGTTLPLLVGAQNLLKWGLCSVEEAIALATLAPRRAIGLPEGVEQA
ncbi:MAG: N-acetylglucosamine-6-phosphate deacetylase, partial [Oculatellaceae cyanobacterium Prado106]|nr:N-acetylglucosamine-6-phosphate deacetylase [Oculatellaceae cyanobacterium Prado106]